METKNENSYEDSQNENNDISNNEITQELNLESIASKKSRFINSLIDFGIVYFIGYFQLFNDVGKTGSLIWFGPLLFVYYFGNIIIKATIGSLLISHYEMSWNFVYFLVHYQTFWNLINRR